MTNSDSIAPRNIQNVEGTASATQINNPQAPVVVDSPQSTFNFTTIQQAHPKPPLPEMPTNLTRRGSEMFVGREDALETLHTLLQQGSAVSICAVSGMGGIGKTELAVQYALKHLKLKTYPGAVCWLNARSDVGTEILSFARSTMNLELPELLSVRELVAWIWGQFPAGDCLIVMDDVQEYQEVEAFLPPVRSRFKVVMTTRSNPPKNVNPLKIEVLARSSSLELLRALVEDGRIDREVERSNQLCEWLGDLPLGVELVGRYLAEDQDVSVSVLWERLQQRRLQALALKEAYPGMTASLGVAAAFELSWERLDEAGRQLAKVLSGFALADIPWELVEGCLPEWDAEELALVRTRRLVNAHLLKRTDAGMYGLHQLLREFFRSKVEVGEGKALKTALVRVMIEIAKQISEDPTLEIIQSITATIPHMQAVAEDLVKLRNREECGALSSRDILQVFTGISRFYQSQRSHIAAEIWYCHCTELIELLFGDEHIDFAISLDNLAAFYASQGRYEEAEQLNLRALELMSSLSGNQNIDFAISLDNLASLYRNQGRYEEAEKFNLQALELMSSLSGDHRRHIATSVMNLASIYDSRGRYQEAEELCLQALDLWQSLPGDTRLDVAATLNNLASIYCAQGQYDKAEALFIQVMQSLQSLLGDSHPYVASNLNNLAGLYQELGRYEQAESLYIQVLELRRSFLSEYHPDVANSLNNLAEFYRLQGRYEQSEHLFIQILELWRPLLGEQHPNVVASMHNLALLYMTQERYGQAEPLFVQVLESRRSVLGEQHPEIATRLNNLAGVYLSQRQYDKAESSFLQALQITYQALGQDHPIFAIDLCNLALLYETLERYAEVEPLYLQSLSIFYQQLGETHPNTQTVWENFINFLQKVIQQDRTSELSNDPTTRSLLEQLQNASEE